MKIPKWQHELAWYYKRGNLISYFLNNAAKTCLYRLKILENIEIGHFFQSRAFFISVAIFTQVASASLREAWQIPKKLPKLKTQLSWKAEYSFLQFSSKESLMFCKTCLKLEDKMKSSKNYNPSFVEGCSNFWNRAIVSMPRPKCITKPVNLKTSRKHKNLEKSTKKKDFSSKYNHWRKFTGQTKLCYDPPSTTTDHQPKYLYHHQPPAKIYPPTPTISHQQPKPVL